MQSVNHNRFIHKTKQNRTATLPLAVFCLVASSTGKLQGYLIPFVPVKALSPSNYRFYAVFPSKIACKPASTFPAGQTRKYSGSSSTNRSPALSAWFKGPYRTNRLDDRPA
jgi:hypothetical protein